MDAHWKQIICGIVMLFLLSGCMQTYEYLKISEHNDPFAQKEETEITQQPEPEAIPLLGGDYYSLRETLSELVQQGVEHGRIQLEQYTGDPEKDLKRAVSFLTKEDPIGAYAVDFINFDCVKEEDVTMVTVDAVYRRSASEIAAIRSVRGIDQAEAQIFEALTRFDSAITLRVSGYIEHDYEAAIRRYCIYNPDKIAEIPQISSAIYPQAGNVRILELHMSYSLTKEEMHNELAEISGVFSSAYNYLRYGQSQRDKADLACAYLSGRFDYIPVPDATVYQLLSQGQAGSTATAAAFYGICQRANIECQIVEGVKDGQNYAWNLLQIDGVWYHADLLQAILTKNTELTLCLDHEMSGYEWDREVYPVCDGAVQS